MPDCQEPLPVCIEKLKCMHEDIACIKTALLGNGDSDKGLMFRVTKLETGVKILVKLLAISLPTIVGVAGLAIALITHFSK